MAHAASLIFPLVVLLMAAGIAEKQLLTAAILVVLSFSCSVRQNRFRGTRNCGARLWTCKKATRLLKSVFEGTGDALFIKDLRRALHHRQPDFCDACWQPDRRPSNWQIHAGADRLAIGASPDRNMIAKVIESGISKFIRIRADACRIASIRF